MLHFKKKEMYGESSRIEITNQYTTNNIDGEGNTNKYILRSLSHYHCLFHLVFKKTC